MINEEDKKAIEELAKQKYKNHIEKLKEELRPKTKEAKKKMSEDSIDNSINKSVENWKEEQRKLYEKARKAVELAYNIFDGKLPTGTSKRAFKAKSKVLKYLSKTLYTMDKLLVEEGL